MSTPAATPTSAEVGGPTSPKDKETPAKPVPTKEAGAVPKKLSDGESGAGRYSLAAPGEDSSNEALNEHPLHAWHNFESQYSIAMEQSALIERETWGSQVEFLMSCIASAVGLGNIWRFPFICGQNGGAAFLVPYMIVLVVIARPMYMMELGLGQFVSGGPVKIWEMAPAFRGVGYTATVASFFLGSFYCCIMGWSLLYMIYSLFPTLPWDKGSFKTVDLGLVKYPKNTPGEFFGLAHLGVPDVKFPNMTQFARGKGLDGPPVFSVAMGLLASWIIIWGTLFAGVSGAGKVAYFTALFPYFVLLVLLIGGATLEGATVGLKYFYYPDFEKIANPKAWFQAVAQCFFSLGLTFGGCVMFASFNKFHHKLGRDIIIIGIMDTFTSLLAGTCMFMLLGYLDVANEKAHKKNNTIGRKSVADLSESQGAGMIFSFLFFFMLVVLAVGSCSGIVGAVVTVICDAYPNWNRKIVVTVLCIVSFWIGLIYTCRTGNNVIDIVDRYGIEQVVFMLAIFQTAAIAYVYGLKNICNDFEFMMGGRLNWYWIISWGIVPVLLAGIFIFYMVTWVRPKDHPDVAVGMGWALTITTWMIVPICMVFIIWTRKTRFWIKKVKASFCPTRKWGPKEPSVREAWRRWKRTKPTEFRPTTIILRFLRIRKDPLPAGTQLFESQIMAKDFIDSQYQAGTDISSSVDVDSDSTHTAGSHRHPSGDTHSLGAHSHHSDSHSHHGAHPHGTGAPGTHPPGTGAHPPGDSAAASK